MIIAFIISLLARIIMPQQVVLINQKLQGFWLVTKDYKVDDENGRLRIIKFEKCKKEARDAKACEISWSYVDSSAVRKKKLDKSIKKNWQPVDSGTYWVEKKRDKKTKKTIIHFEDFTNIAISVLKKELNVYQDTTLAQQAKKLK